MLAFSFPRFFHPVPDDDRSVNASVPRARPPGGPCGWWEAVIPSVVVVFYLLHSRPPGGRAFLALAPFAHTDIPFLISPFLDAEEQEPSILNAIHSPP